MKRSVRVLLTLCLAVLGTMLFGKPIAHALDSAPAMVVVLAWLACAGVAAVLAWDARRVSQVKRED